MIELRPMTPAFLAAVVEGRLEDAAAELNVTLPPEFPRPGDLSFFELRLGQMRKDERFLDWCPHAVVVEGAMIGHAGYHGPPGKNARRDPSAVEFGYAIEPSYRGRGYATLAAQQLLDLAESRGVRRFVLSCAPENAPSIAIIRKLGFVHTGEVMDEEDGLELVFELERA